MIDVVRVVSEQRQVDHLKSSFKSEFRIFPLLSSAYLTKDDAF
jgi:hypothetical protein